MIGAAVRTNYDSVNLKAKGFVYISPETGVLALDDIDAAAGGRLAQKRWGIQSGKLLKLVLAHERCA